MAPDGSLDWQRFGRQLGAGVLVLLSVVLVTRALPIPASPFLLGASAAIVYWLVRASLTGD